MGTLADHPVRTGLLGQVLYHFSVLDSTNAYALKLLLEIRPKHGTVVSADYQTAGRGQAGRTWYSSPGQNLCLSVILYPAIPAQEQFRLNMAVSLGVRDTVAEFLPRRPVQIKWPNDIYVEDRKIAGILIQNSVQGNRMTSCVAGIGLNVYEMSFPVDVPNPTSLQIEHAAPRDLAMVRDVLLQHLTSRYAQLSDAQHLLSTDYQDALYRKEQRTRFRIMATGSIQEGRILQVHVSGKLAIAWNDGTKGEYLHKELEFL